MMLRMFLRADVVDQFARLYASGIVPTAQQLLDFKAARARRPRLAAKVEGARSGSNEPENYAVVGNTAYIAIEGVLSEEPDFWSWIFGLDGTTYADIRSAFALAGGSPDVTKVQLLVGSPGGYIDGLFETLAMIEGFKKPISVDAVQACSAAYALAAMAGPIRASGPAAEFGSVGIAATFYVDPERVNVASRDAPRKRPDLTTPEGIAVVQDELDAFHEIFVDAIARGRQHATGEPFNAKRVNADFGRGGVLLTDKAKAAKMVDKAAPQVRRGSQALEVPGRAAMLDRLVLAAAADDEPTAPVAIAAAPAAAPPPSSPAAPEGGSTPRPQPEPSAPQSTTTPPATGQGKKKVMTKEELQAQFPGVYSAIHDEGKAAGVAEGQASERKRVNAHLKAAKGPAAKAQGTLKVALDAISTGKSFLDEEVQAEYMDARHSSDTQAGRQQDSDQAGAALGDAGNPAATGSGGKDFGDAVAEAYEKN